MDSTIISQEAVEQFAGGSFRVLSPGPNSLAGTIVEIKVSGGWGAHTMTVTLTDCVRVEGHIGRSTGDETYEVNLADATLYDLEVGMMILGSGTKIVAVYAAWVQPSSI